MVIAALALLWAGGCATPPAACPAMHTEKVDIGHRTVSIAYRTPAERAAVIRMASKAEGCDL